MEQDLSDLYAWFKDINEQFKEHFGVEDDRQTDEPLPTDK